MTKFTKELVDDLADKLLIGLTEEENKMVLDEFDVIDKNCDIVTTIEGIENIEPMTHALDDFEVVLREDEAEEWANIEELLQNCDKTDGCEIELPKVVQ